MGMPSRELALARKYKGQRTKGWDPLGERKVVHISVRFQDEDGRWQLVVIHPSGEPEIRMFNTQVQAEQARVHLGELALRVGAYVKYPDLETPRKRTAARRKPRLKFQKRAGY